MRLIDADRLIAFIDKGKYCNPNALTFSENDVCEMINQQPTAYDVDRVVERLERIRRIAFFTIANTGNEESDVIYTYASKIVDDAIDIVRRGGTNEQD